MAIAAVVLETMPADWECWDLVERESTVLEADGSNCCHRYQVVSARRGNAIYKEVTDMGATLLWQHDLLHILSLGQSSVGNVRDMAMEMRAMRPFAERMGLGMPDMLDLFRQYSEERWLMGQHRSVFGSAVAHVRS